MTPERRRFLARKLLAYLLAGALLGVAAMAVTFAVGLPWLSARDAPLELLDLGDYVELATRASRGRSLGRHRRGNRRHRAQPGRGGGRDARLPVRARAGGGRALDRGRGLHPGRLPDALASADLEDSLDPLPAGLVLTGWALAIAALAALLEERRDVT